MNRLDHTLGQLKAKGEKALITYIMAGDPSLQETEQLVLELERAGADGQVPTSSNWGCPFPIPSPMDR